MTLAGVAATAHAVAPRCGATRLVCIDGPSGSGKTDFAANLAPALGDPPVLHMDDLYPGWDGLAAAVPLLHSRIVSPLLSGRPARYRRYDWALGEYADEHNIGMPPLLVVEGVGAGARIIAAHAVLLIWIEAPEAIRFERAMERDGDVYRAHWDRWAQQELDHYAVEHTRDRADVIVDATNGTLVRACATKVPLVD